MSAPIRSQKYYLHENKYLFMDKNDSVIHQKPVFGWLLAIGIRKLTQYAFDREMLGGLVLVFLVLLTVVVLGQDCTLDDAQSTLGTCRPIRNCTFAVNNLYADVRPKICSGKTVCCPTQDTIAERKCRKWLSYLHVPTAYDWIYLPEPECRKKNDGDSSLVGSRGRDGEKYEFPHAVALGYGQLEAELQYLCGGTLISDEYILTAAHCIRTYRGNPTFALLGDIALFRRTSRYRQIIPISEAIIHPNYTRPLIYNDIALLRLKVKVQLNPYLIPACLPWPGPLAQSEFLEAVGWGKLGHGEPQAQILQVLNLTEFNRKECGPYYSDRPDRKLRFPDGLRRTQMCAGDTTKSGMDTCNGDSGGPLTQRENLRCIFRVIGITSFGPNLCGYGTPGVYTKVLSYVPWIERIAFGST